MRDRLRCATLVALLGILIGSVPAAARADHTPPDETECLALTLYFEAGNEGEDGMLAVAAVVFNRLRHDEFPATVCEVVKEGGETPPCQFSWWCDGKSDQPPDNAYWHAARDLAHDLLAEPPPDPTDRALFYHAVEIEVPWFLELTRTAQIGNHIFYR